MSWILACDDLIFTCATNSRRHKKMNDRIQHLSMDSAVVTTMQRLSGRKHNWCAQFNLLTEKHIVMFLQSPLIKSVGPWYIAPLQSVDRYAWVLIKATRARLQFMGLHLICEIKFQMLSAWEFPQWKNMNAWGRVTWQNWFISVSKCLELLRTWLAAQH